jgi:hypothetical protein
MPRSDDVDASAVRRAWLRATAIADLLASAEPSAEEAPRWQRPWTKRWQTALGDLRAARMQQEEDSEPTDAQIAAAEQHVAQHAESYILCWPAGDQQRVQIVAACQPLADRLGATLVAEFNDAVIFEIPRGQSAAFRDAARDATKPLGVAWQSTDQPPLALRSERLWPALLDRRTPTATCVVEGSSASLEVATSQDRSDGAGGRWLAAAALAALTAVAAWTIRRRVLTGLVTARPHAVGVAVGLLWWLCLWPSWLGWLVVVLFAALGIAQRWSPPFPAPAGSGVFQVAAPRR